MSSASRNIHLYQAYQTGYIMSYDLYVLCENCPDPDPNSAGLLSFLEVTSY